MSREAQKSYQSLTEIVLDMADILRPAERLSVSQAAEKYRYLNNQGSYVGPWKNETTPYMVEPMDALTSRDYNAVVFVGVFMTVTLVATIPPLRT